MLKLASLTQTCPACPEQYEGRTEDGRHVYIRHRHGHGYVGVGDTLGDAVSGSELLAEWEGDDGMIPEPLGLDGVLRLAGLSFNSAVRY